jgi:hypothetical protein
MHGQNNAWKERIKYVGPYGEHTTVVFVPIGSDTGLERVHPTWAGAYILDACVYLFPTINFALIDSHCVPVTPFEIQELWLSCDDRVHSADPCPPDQMPASPIAPAHSEHDLLTPEKPPNSPAHQLNCPNLEVWRTY